jgi:hypothetical protein
MGEAEVRTWSGRLWDTADAKVAEMDWEMTAAVGAEMSGIHMQRKRHAKNCFLPFPNRQPSFLQLSSVCASFFRVLGFPS